MDPELIQAMINAQAVFPDLRFGQLLSNACRGKDLFYLNNKDLARLLREFVVENWTKKEIE